MEKPFGFAFAILLDSILITNDCIVTSAGLWTVTAGCELMLCPYCKIGPMIPKPFGYYQCRLVDLKYVPSELDTSLFNPLCLLMQKLG